MKNKFLKTTLATIVAVILFCGCGIKGPPLPPIETIEAEAINGKAMQTTGASSATTQVAPASADTTKSKK